EKRAVDIGQVGWLGWPAGIDIVNEDSTVCRAVALPQLVAVRAIVGGKKQGALDVGQITGKGADIAGVDVGDHDRAGGRAIALPKFGTGSSVVSNEKKRTAHGRQIGVNCSQIKVLDKNRTRGGAIALPKLLGDTATIHNEEQGAIDVRQVGGIQAAASRI